MWLHGCQCSRTTRRRDRGDFRQPSGHGPKNVEERKRQLRESRNRRDEGRYDLLAGNAPLPIADSIEAAGVVSQLMLDGVGLRGWLGAATAEGGERRVGRGCRQGRRPRREGRCIVIGDGVCGRASRGSRGVVGGGVQRELVELGKAAGLRAVGLAKGLLVTDQAEVWGPGGSHCVGG